MAEDLMRYDLLAQDALRGVVRAAMQKVAREGLPGDHHFYIAFRTRAPGVKVSDRLLGKYPKEMTIVLQHQFWGLDVGEDRFVIELSFENIPEKLIVPFSAITGFFDPSVQFGLQFESADAAARPEELAAGEPADAAGEEPSGELAEPAVPAIAADNQDEAGGETGADVVRLDTFRKKT